MPSPASKRKRTNSQHLSVSNTANPSTPDLLQPSSRDASGEEGDESAGPAVTSTAKPSAQIPPSKRARKASIMSATSNGDARKDAPISKEDPGEPSETTLASSDIETQTKARPDLHLDVKSQGQELMKPPELGKLQDPAGGYKTNTPPTGRPVRVYADGVFDLFHVGHMRQLEQAKKAFPDVYLIVGVTGDKETHERKGLTVLSGAERAESVRHCKWVDEVIPNCPWIVTTEFMDAHQIDYVAHDDLPYGAAEGDDIYAPIKAQGKFLVTQRTEGVSTTGIITRIVRDYDRYISRQFKRGASREELNVSWLKKNELEIKRHVSELRDSIMTNWTNTGQELSRELRQLWNSRPNSPAPSARASVDFGSSRGMVSPTAGKSHVSRVEALGRSESINGREPDFATGYSLGLIGGVEIQAGLTVTQQMRSRRSLLESRGQSPTSEEERESEVERSDGLRAGQ
ncbi:hypothetical protein BJX61DRAFT_538526 [Aspergillus egyptiacus]|nr:hypothetical protein BJX61DRAFT_538526 [Aspergillus egyptiacus]